MTADASWWVATPPRTHGAIGIVSIESGDLERTLGDLGLPAIEVALWRLADLLGVDRGVIARYSATRADLMPHGGPLVTRKLTEALSARGVEHRAKPDPRSVYPEASSEIEARMLATLARAASPLAIDLLLDQPRRWAEAGEDTTELADGGVLRRLIEPPLVAAIGPPNIGKSTLLNALAGRTEAVVADQPGTTRDHVGVLLDLGGLVVRYLDTPGLLAEPTGPDAAAIESAMRVAGSADLVLRCSDPTAAAPEFDGPALRVGLRADLGEPLGEPEIEVHAPSREGLDRLVAAIIERLMPSAVREDPRPWRFWA